MGNWFSSQRYFYFLEEYEILAEQLDESSVRLKHSLDSMQNVSELLFEQLQNNGEEDHVNSNGVLERSRHLTSHLMKTIHESVVAHKDTTFRLLLDLLKYVADIFNSKLNSLDPLKDTFKLEQQLDGAGDVQRTIEKQNIQENVEKIMKLTKELKSSKKDLELLSYKYNTLKSEKAGIEKKMKVSLDKAKGDAETLKKARNAEISKHDKAIQKLQKEMDTMNKTKADKIKQLQKENDEFRKRKTEDISNLQNEIDSLKKDMAKLTEGNQEYSSQIDSLQEKNNRIETDKTQLQTELDELKASNEQLKNEAIAQRETEIKELQLQVNQLESSIRDKIDENTMKNKKIEEQHIQLSNLSEKCQELEKTVNKLKQGNSYLNDRIKSQSEEMTELTSELQTLRELSSKQMIKVQMWFNQRTSINGGFEACLMAHLKTQFSSDKVELQFKQCATPSDAECEDILLVVCVVTSRIGTDVANAVEGVNLSNNRALLVVHHKDAHALPEQASERILTAKEYKQLGGIFDMAYLRDKGVYDCNMNATSIIGLVDFIEKAGVRKPLVMLDRHN